MKRQALFIFSAFLLLFFSSSVSSQRIWQVLTTNPTFQLLRVELGRKAAPLISTYLNADGSNITLFGPTEDAMYDNIPALQPLPAATITEIMNYHIATGALPSSYVASQYVIQSAYAPANMGGRPQRLTVFVNTTDGTTANVFINGIGLVTYPDISASNGIIHGISAVLRPPNVTVMDTLIARQPATFNTLINFLNAQNLQTTFRQDGGVTLFAPTDAAWAQLQQAQPAIYQAIVTDPPTLTKFLQYHATSTLVYAGEAPLGSSSVPSVAGPNLEVVKSNATLTVNGAPVTTTNILCKNGVVHVIDRVLIPPDFVPNLRVILRGQGLTTMISQMDANGLGSILDDLSTNHTVYAPTNAAFTAYTGQVNADLLSYHFSDEYDRTSSFYQGELGPTHYMPGSLLNQSQRLQVSIVNASTTFINNARLVSGDYAAANGIIHILDRVMPLPPTLATIVRSTATFSTLATLLNSTGMLTGALSVTPGLTLFAPTDAAFALVDRQVLRYLTRPLAAPVLANVLSYHVINGATSGNTIFYAMNVPSGVNSVTMLSGETASFNKTGSFSISVNAKSNVAKADTLAANGVLHTVDSVMVPPSFVFNLQKALVGADVTDFLALVQNTTELAPLLTGTAGYTIFAPTNAALAALPRPLPTGAALVQLLQYHFVSGVTMRNALVNGTVVPTLLFPAGLGGAAQVLRVNITSNTTILVNGVNITMANNTAVNGVVHVIDKVLIPPADINGTLAGNPSFSIFNSLLAGSGLAELFAGVNRTLFVPDNNAFASLNAFTRQYLMRPSMLPILRDVLGYHLVVSSVLYSANIPMGTTTIAMANDVTVTVMKSNNTLTVNGVPVTRPDILVSNGVIHGVSRLLLPPGKYDFSLIPALQAVNATLFLDAIESSGTVGPFLVMQAKRTVFAPSNRAMQAVQVMPTGDALVQLLKYHLVNGSFLASSFSDRQLLFSNLNLTSLRGAAQRLRITIDAATRRRAVNNATLLTFNDLATNGVVHLIDRVLMPPADILSVAGALPQNCSTFVYATTFAGLAPIFKRSALTSFIPTNQAFRTLPKNLLKYLLLGPTSAQDLNSFITYHLINQFLLYSPDFPVRGSFPTQQGPPVILGRITGPTGRSILKVNDANVVVSALAANGVVHVLDEVLVPPTFQFTLDKLLLALDSELFRAYLKKAKLHEWTISTDPVTFFVPTDNAFLEDAPKLDKLQRNELVQLMANHIVRGKFDSIEPGDRLVTLSGNTLIVSSDENSNALYVTLEGNVTPQTLAVVVGGTVNPALNGDVYQVSHVLQREGNQHLEPGTIASIVLLSLLFAVVIVGFAAYVYKQFKDLNHYTQLG